MRAARCACPERVRARRTLRVMMRLEDGILVDDLVIRRIRTADLAEVHRAIEESRDHLRPFIPFASADPEDIEFRREWISRTTEQFDEGSSFNYGVFIAERFIGGCSVVPRTPGVASIGYWIHRAHTRRGYGTKGGERSRDDSGVCRVLHSADST